MNNKSFFYRTLKTLAIAFVFKKGRSKKRMSQRAAGKAIGKLFK